VHGVIVTRVDPTGTAFASLRRGMVIMEINRQPLRSVLDYDRIVGAARPGDVLAFYVFESGRGERVLLTGPGRMTRPAGINA
jgi:S1-C subfamily serine protease